MKKNYADMDPLEEVRAIRAELNSEFATVHDLCEYMRKLYPLNKPSSKAQPKGRRATAKTPKRSAGRLRKTTAHA